MTVLKSIAVAFSMYSRIPMPRFKWASEDMKYHLIFFPWIGAVIGGLEYLWLIFCTKYEITHIAFVVVAMALPIIVTGGFHLDGFMDTSDALASWGDKEKRLEILKDSHVGAFAVIRLISLGLILFASLLSVDMNGFVAWLFSLFAIRAVSGICVVRNKKAKSDGILNTSAETAADNVVAFCLAIQFVTCTLVAGMNLGLYWTMAMLAIAVSLVYYIYVAYSKFGGITGDLAGWFVCVGETLTAVAVALFSVIR